MGTKGQHVIADFVWASKHSVVDTDHVNSVDITGKWRESASRTGFLGGNYLVWDNKDPISTITYVWRICYIFYLVSGASSVLPPTTEFLHYILHNPRFITTACSSLIC